MADDFSDDQRSFLQTYTPLAQDVAGQTGLDPSVVLGQVAQETGWGKHVQGNNIFGISPGGAVANYPTVQDAANAYVKLMKSTYAPATTLPTPEAQARAIAALGYNPSPSYAPSVIQIAQQIRGAGPVAGMSDADLDKTLLTPPSASGPADVTVRPSARQHDPIAAASDADLDKILSPNAGAPPKPGEIDPVTGQPAQFASTAGNDPVAQSMGRPVAEGQEPGVVTQAAISLPTDPEAKRRIAAAQLFPNEQPLQAQSRMFYAPDGRLAAVGQDGNPFYVDPQPPSVDLQQMKFRLGNPLLSTAALAGPSMSTGAGLGAGAMAGPGSMILGPGLAAGGAAVGDLARQYAARWLDPSRTPPPIDLGQTATQAALAGGGQLVGGALNSALAPNALRVSPGEVRVMRSAPVMADTRAAYGRAAAQGVQLTPGQATGLPSLLQYEDAATTMPQTVDAATNFYRAQGNQLQRAGQAMLGNISPVADKNAGAAAFQGGSEDAIRLARQNANAAARPAYNAAQAAGQVVSPDLAQLAAQPAVADAMRAAGRTYENLYGRPPPDTPDFALWDLTKRQLDDAHGIAARAGQRTDAMAIDNLRGRLVSNLDAAYPTYGAARATAAPGQQLASELEQSGVGTVADKTGDERARAIVSPVFAQNNPAAISRARDAFASAGRSDEWNAGVRSYIQDAFDKASQSQQGLNPSMLRRQVWGNVDNRDAIQAALTPPQYAGFDRFMQTVEDVARTYPMNSLTATRTNARGALLGAATDQGNVRAVRTVMGAFSPIRLADTLGRAGDAVANRMVQNNMQRIVGRLFSPDGLQYLEAMSTYAPGAQRAIEATAQLVGRATAGSLSAPAANQNQQQSANPLQTGTGR